MKQEKINTPMLDSLASLRGRAWLHMPGHGGDLSWLNAGLDMTELPVSDDLHAPAEGGFFIKAQALYARAAGAQSSLFLTGGSTLGVQAMLLAFSPPGSKVILPRDTHRAAISACAIGGLAPVYVYPVWDERAGRAFVRAEDVLKAIDMHPDARALLLTSPDYYGVCTGMETIAGAARKADIALLADEAHGAHLPWGDRHLSAANWADAWTQSAHKTLPALTQSAVLHLREKRNEAAVRRVVHMLASSSPSFLLAGSVDYARAAMDTYGGEWLAIVHEQNKQALDVLQQAGYGNAHALWREDGRSTDSARLVIDCYTRGWSGYAVQSALTHKGIDIEMADERRIVCIPPIRDGKEPLRRLVQALLELPDGEYIPPMPLMPQEDTEQALSVRDAAFASAIERPVEDASGCIAAEPVGAYPPGVPFLLPGERIADWHIEALVKAQDSGARLFGIENGNIAIVEE